MSSAAAIETPKLTDVKALKYGLSRADRFAKVWLGHKTWKVQNQILRAIDEHQQIAVKACHSSSKALALDTPLPTPSGWTTMGEISVGDLLYDEMGRPARVVSLSPVMEKFCYRVVFSTGESLVASDDHLWSAQDLKHRPRNHLDWRGQWHRAVDATTEQMAMSLTENGQYRWRIPTGMPIHGNKWPMKTPPYTFGAWLGDGTTIRADITCANDDAAYWVEALKGRRMKTSAPNACRVLFGRQVLDCPGRETGGVKRIPIGALRADYDSRLALLRGLMDTDGWHCQGRAVSFSQMDRGLALEVRALVNTFGWKSSLRQQPAILNGKFYGVCSVVSFAPTECPFSLPRKAKAWTEGARLSLNHASRATIRTIVAIEPAGIRKTRCLGIDSPRRLYLAGEGLIPTHNSYSAAEAVLYWLTKHFIAHEPAVAITTAPTDRQVENIVWREIRNAASDAAAVTGIVFPSIHMKKLEFAEDCYGFGMPSTKEGVRFHGFKGNVLLVVDEAMGIPLEAWDSFDGLRASGRIVILAIGNPTFSGGGFYDLFNLHRERWHRITIDAFDTPNFEGVTLERLLEMSPEELDTNPWPSLANRRWVRNCYLDWVGIGGKEEESPRWLGKVRGVFPKQDPYQLIWTKYIDAAAAAEVPEPSKRRLSVGIDVAGPGEDETVVYVLDQGRIVDWKAWSIADPRAQCVLFLEKYRRELGIVNVDSIGMGYYFALHIGDHHFPVSLVNVGDASADERYRNLKADAYFKLRDSFEKGRITNLTDETTMAQLATIRHLETKQGITEIESKESMRRRGCKSPDRAEALMLANLGEASASFAIPEKIGAGLKTQRSMRP